jgi:hypothetical protein
MSREELCAWVAESRARQGLPPTISDPTEATIKTHLLHIYAKLGVRDRAAAVGEAYRRGLLT